MEGKKLHENIQQLFSMCRLLRYPLTVKELERKLGVSQRQVYRYLDVIDKLNYPLVKNKTRYYIASSSPNAVNDSPLPDANNFDEKYPTETQILLLHESFKHRLLAGAIKNKQVVRLLNYQSPQDGTLADRLVEPLYVNDDFKRLQCYCRTEKKQRQYKIVRIGEVEVSDEIFTKKHDPQPMDAFGLSGPEWLPVRMRLHKRAYHLLWEEFISARPDISRDKEAWYYEGRVLSYYGIGRFVLGLPGDVSGIEPVAFREFLTGRTDNFSF